MTSTLARWLAPVLFVAAACGKPSMTNAPPAAPMPAGNQAVVLISLDAFRWDYLSRPNAVNLRRLAATGVHAERMVPSFPSLTFPNHYTIATGLYPEHHGIVANNILDAALGKFGMSDTNAVRNVAWWGGEPIWITAEKQGRRAGAFFWPGSEVAHDGVWASRWMKFDDKFPNAARIDSVLKWLTLPNGQALSLVTLYYSDVDHAGHEAGPATPAVDSAIARVDSQVGRLIDGLAASGLSNRVNIIVVSDHGMTAISPDRAIFLDDYITATDVDIAELGAMATLSPRPGKGDEVYRKLKGASPHFATYRKGEVPVRFHYDTNARIAPLILTAEEGWMFTTHDRFAKRKPMGGAHGFDNQLSSMGASFIAAGPAFRVGYTSAPFQNIHVYDLLCHILGLTPAKNDGSLDSTRVLLRR
jgi:predicted AlkP superfamily pyrophosphatase or phosphodiesterase